MQFKPKTEKEIAEENLWPAGVYNFEIAEAVEGVSKSSGNEMITLTLNIYNDAGKSQIIFDYLTESMAYKLRHAAEACGLLEKYETGSLNDYDFEGKRGELKLVIEKDRTGNYPDKNKVVDYIVEKKDVSKDEPELDDDVPF